VWRQTVLGGDDLRQRVLATVDGSDPREIPGFSPARAPGLSLEGVVDAVAEYTGVPAENVYRGKFQRVLARKLALYLARRFTGLTLREIGAAFGVDYTTVHMAARRVEELRGVDEAVDELLREIEAALPGAAAAPGVAPSPVPGPDSAVLDLAVAPDPEPVSAAEPVPAPDPAPPVERPRRPGRKRGKAKKDSPQLKLF
jgi:hypothetical protein